MNMIKKLLLPIIILAGVFALGGQRAYAAEPPLATNVYPNERATTTGYPLYMTIGTGEFPVGTAVAAIIVQKPGVYKLTIEDAAFCNLDSYFSDRALDLPLSYRGSESYFKTSFSVLDKVLQFKQRNNSGGVATTETGFERDCENRDRDFTFKVDAKTSSSLGDWDNEVNAYRVIFLASNAFAPLNYAYYPTAPGAAENSFKIRVTDGPSGGDPRIYFSTKRIGNSNLNNVSNRNRPTDNYANYIATLGLKCRLNPEQRTVEADLNFYDVDNGLYQDTPPPNYQPPLQFKVQYKINAASNDPDVYDHSIPPPTSNWQDYPGYGDWITIPGGGGTVPQTVLNDFKFWAGTKYKVEVRGLTYRNAATYSLTSENVTPYFADEENCEPANEPVGFIDSCELLSNGKTIIRGWAYDADANNNNRPNVSLKVGSDTDEVPTNKDYYPNKVKEWLQGAEVYSGDAFDGIYGWEVTKTLVPGRDYTISGTVDNFGDTGSDRNLRINSYNVSKTPDPGDLNVFPSNQDGSKRLPDRCVPELEVPVKCVGKVTIDDNEAGKPTAINVTIAHGPTSDRAKITVTSVVFDQLTDMTMTGGIRPGLPNEINRNDDETYSRDVTFSKARAYDLGATVRYVFNGSSETLEKRCTGPATTYIKPYLKVFGGDVWAGGGFYGNKGSDSSIYAFAERSGSFKGSSGQFGVTALRNIKSLYSAGQVSSRQPKSTTFANDSTGADNGNPRADSTYGGGYRPGGSNTGIAITDYYTDTRDTSQTSTFTSSSLSADAGTKQYVMGTSLGSNSPLPGDGAGGALVIPRGTQAAVYVIGDLYITKNVLYNFTQQRSSTSDIPFFAVIVKGNIFIDKEVTRLDGLYIAQPTNAEASQKGKIFTCSSIANGAVTLYNTGSTTHDNECDKQLVVNGSMIARQIKFLRVKSTLYNATSNESINFANGAGTGAGEVINFNPELYLAPSPLKNPDESTTTPKYDAIFSLPPVF